jgi:hypothetical protein
MTTPSTASTRPPARPGSTTRGYANRSLGTAQERAVTKYSSDIADQAGPPIDPTEAFFKGAVSAASK